MAQRSLQRVGHDEGGWGDGLSILAAGAAEAKVQMEAAATQLGSRGGTLQKDDLLPRERKRAPEVCAKGPSTETQPSKIRHHAPV